MWRGGGGGGCPDFLETLLQDASCIQRGCSHQPSISVYQMRNKQCTLNIPTLLSLCSAGMFKLHCLLLVTHLADRNRWQR